MIFWGLHVADWAVIFVSLAAILLVGILASHNSKSQADFYVGGRKLGKTLQFFLNFGNAGDSTGAIGTGREVYRQGAGGVWISLQTLFITPFYWFTQPWYRRARLVTMGDLFVDVFNSKSLAMAYAMFSIIIALITMTFGNVASYKATAAMLPKPLEALSATERQAVEGYNEYQQLRTQRLAGTLPADKYDRFDELDNLNKLGRLQSEISYLDGDYANAKKFIFIAIYSLIIGIYIILGGLRAAAKTNAIQGLMIIVMSLMLIPLGLRAVGGFSGLHARIPDVSKFWLAGSAATSEYTWYTIFAIFLGSFVQMLGLVHNMSASGSAKDEDAARFGMLSGGFTKRIIIIAWMFCALIGAAMFQGANSLSDPDKVWGKMSLELLGPGLLGLMLSGIVLGHMPAVALAAVSVSGLIARNVYEPLIKGKSVRHYLVVGQLAIAFVLIMSTLTSMASNNLLNIVRDMILFNTYFGAVVFLIFFWRRLTAPAIWVGLIIWLVLIGIIPQAMPSSARRSENLLLQTQAQQTTVKAPATEQDVADQKAQHVGQPIDKPYTVAPVACFFERVVRVDPSNPQSAMEGFGRFNVEIYIMSLLGLPVGNFGPAGLQCTRWLFDALLPFVMLIVFSWVTPRPDPLRVARFQAKMKTPVAPTPEMDHEEVEKSYAQPSRFDHTKLLPGTNWEFTKWTRKDVVGFSACWGIVLLILGLLYAIVTIGTPSGS